MRSVRLARGFGKAASHLIVEFLGGPKFHVVREATRLRLDYLLPARRPVPPPQEDRQHEWGNVTFEISPRRSSGRERMPAIEADLTLGHSNF